MSTRRVALLTAAQCSVELHAYAYTWPTDANTSTWLIGRTRCSDAYVFDKQLRLGNERPRKNSLLYNKHVVCITRTADGSHLRVPPISECQCRVEARYRPTWRQERVPRGGRPIRMLASPTHLLLASPRLCQTCLVRVSYHYLAEIPSTQ